MYSQYQTAVFSPLEQQSPGKGAAAQTAPPENRPPGDAIRQLSGLFGGLLRPFSLGRIDLGDVLLVLIVLLLYLDGDNWDLIIALGLTLLLSGRDQSAS